VTVTGREALRRAARPSLPGRIYFCYGASVGGNSADSHPIGVSRRKEISRVEDSKTLGQIVSKTLRIFS
jgi:hypothetical protein